MAITIDYGNTNIINIPQADLSLVGGTLYELDTEWFRLALKDVEDSEAGIAFPTTHVRNAPVTVAGTTLAQTLEILYPYRVEFENGSYTVRLAGSNNNLFDVENGILVQNNVQVIAQNSAGLVNVNFLIQLQQESLFQGCVHIDTFGSTTGTEFPRGTATEPVNNLADAVAIANRIGVRCLKLTGLVALDRPFQFWAIQGLGAVAEIDINGQDISGTRFEACGVYGNCGVLTQRAVVDLGRISPSGLTNFVGVVARSVFDGNLSLEAGSTSIIDCASNIAGTTRPKITSVGISIDLSVRGWIGGFDLRGVNGVGDNVSIDMVSGTLELNATCNAGVIVCRGIAEFINFAQSGATVIRSGLLDPSDLEFLTFNGGVHIDSIDGNDNNRGTEDDPVATATAAKIIADAAGFSKYFVKGGLNLQLAHDDWTFVGMSPVFGDVVNMNGQSVEKARFEDLELYGDGADSEIEAIRCNTDGLTGVYGMLRNCGVVNRISVETSLIARRTYTFDRCYDQGDRSNGQVYAPVPTGRYHTVFGESQDIMADWDQHEWGQSFTGNGKALTRARFQLNRDTDPPGTLRAKLYAHSGTYGISGVPTGPALAISTNSITALTLPALPATLWAEFFFDGAFVMGDGTKYVIAVELVGHSGFDGWVEVNMATGIVAEHEGNASKFNGTTWVAAPTVDLKFSVEYDVAIDGRPVLDFNNSAQDHDVKFVAYVGGLNVQNMPQGTLDVSTPAGAIDLKSTVTGGDIVLKGTGTAVDNSAGATVLNELVSPKTVWDHPTIEATDPASIGWHVLDHLHDLHYEGRVFVDTVNGVSGTVHPIGTRDTPVDNFADAAIIANARNLTTLRLVEDGVVQATDDISSFEIEGTHPMKVQLNILAGALTDRCQFRNLYMRNCVLQGWVAIREGLVENVTGFRGVMHQTMLNPGVIGLAAGAGGAHFLSCYSGQPGFGTPIIDIDGKNLDLGIRDYNGGITLRNNTAANNISIDMASGQVVLEASVVDGDIACRGIGKLTDNSVGANVLDELIDPVDIRLMKQIAAGKVVISIDDLTATIYDEDETTVLLVLDRTADGRMRTPQ